MSLIIMAGKSGYLVPFRNTDLHSPIQINLAVLKFLEQIYTAHSEKYKGIPVNLHAHHVYNSGNMFARHGKIRTVAIHFQISPLSREYTDIKRRSNIKKIRIKYSI